MDENREFSEGFIAGLKFSASLAEKCADTHVMSNEFPPMVNAIAEATLRASVDMLQKKIEQLTGSNGKL